MRLAVVIIAALIATAPGLARGQASITNPRWIDRPTPEDAGEFYPRFAALLGVRGRAEIECVIRADGDFGPCSIIREQPEGLGFGVAGVQTMLRGRLQPRTVDGKPQSGRVRAPISFSIGVSDEEIAASTETPEFPSDWSDPTPAKIDLALRLFDAFPENYDRAERFPLDGLTAERRSVVLEWLDDIYGERRDREERRYAATLIAGFVTEGRLRAAVKDGALFPGEPPSALSWMQAARALAARFDTEAPYDQLARRYCARYDCLIDGEDARIFPAQGSSSTSQ